MPRRVTFNLVMTYSPRRALYHCRLGFVEDTSRRNQWPLSSPPRTTEPAAVNGRNGAPRVVPADKAECRLWVQKGDDRRNAPQRARCADSGHCAPWRAVYGRERRVSELRSRCAGFLPFTPTLPWSPTRIGFLKLYFGRVSTCTRFEPLPQLHEDIGRRDARGGFF
jgi:hypothetical protein